MVVSALISNSSFKGDFYGDNLAFLMGESLDELINSIDLSASDLSLLDLLYLLDFSIDAWLLPETENLEGKILFLSGD